ncbi:multiple epidermal growth factor-like domains protein 10 [Mya arenaria]|uniref:multiple epidermal growth factor-like domains protein 10 n=1 Tax=Mya arenaria TaxID=6604 RepID=UPI0022E4984F|nr:multiple epidermal growth factor-like domains protein 10 [Mya arenaria]
MNIFGLNVSSKLCFYKMNRFAVVFIFTLYLTLDICKSTGTQCPDSCEACIDAGTNFVCNCSKGAYYINGDCAPCSTFGINCERCSNASQCEECFPGKWGPHCIKDCGDGCKDGKCYFKDGSCTCIQEYYGSDCKNQCSKNCLCSTCLDNGHCNCTPGHYLQTCSAPCFSACEECTNSSSCTVCPFGKFGNYCQNNCQCSNETSCDIITGDCISRTCPQTCTSCVDSEHCTGCTVGWFGGTCGYACSSNCFGGCVQSSGFCNACSHRYFGSNCDLECSYCSDNDCTRNGECNNCYPGYFGTFCNLNCPSTCPSKCNQADGSCTFYCPANCLTCSESYSCTRCKDLYYGYFCGLLCSTTCKQGKCDIQSGHCVECNYPSYYGDFCNTSCRSACSTNRCERQTGSCFGCKDEKMYGTFCNITCNRKCKDEMCSQENGHCINGCIPNYYGSTCENVCSKNCVGSTTESKCDSNGMCINGCIDGFIGDTCTTEGHNQQTEETNSGSVIGGTVGGVIGVCIVVALVVVVLVLKKKGIVRKESKKTYEDISPGKIQDEPYTTLAVESTTEYEIPDSEARSELTIEGEDNRVYYNDEMAYYKNIGGNVHKT